MLALVPTILKGPGLVGGFLLRWLGRVEMAIARPRLLATVPLSSPLKTAESPPNTVVIYMLE